MRSVERAGRALETLKANVAELGVKERVRVIRGNALSKKAWFEADAPDVRYSLVAILFILFDLEIAFFFPWAVSLRDIGWTGTIAGFVFLAILTVGFLYEWKKGALNWE